MMLSQLSVTVCLMLMCLSSDGQFCTTSPLQFVSPTFDVCKYNAYCKESDQNTSLRHSECNYSCFERPELKITNKVVNSKLGIMEVTFIPFTVCNYSAYEITLFVNEIASNNLCSSITYADTRKHSSKSAFVETCEPSGKCISTEPCDENVTLVFNHVFTGCYMFKIQPKIGSNTRQAIWTLPQRIITDYEKNLVIGVQPNFSVQYLKNSESMEVSVTFPFLPRASLLILTEGIDPSLGLDACSQSGYTHSSCKMCTDEREIECDDVRGVYNNANCKYWNGNVLTCVFHNVSSGNYCARIQFLDDRCDTSSVWATNENNSCIWDYHYMANETDIIDTPVLDKTLLTTDSRHTTAYIIVPILVVSSILLLSVMAFVVYKQLSAQYHVFIPTYNKELKPLHVKERPTVLLLYARDCDMFMNVMAEFRTILKSSLKCQVFDCWDPAQYEDVAPSCIDWVRSLIANKSVRIILVATPCSRLLEASLLTDEKRVQYRKPLPFDNLFVFALRHLTETTILDSYNRIFVVRLDRNVQNNNSSLTYLNPLTVHFLPTHLDKLMLGLHRVDAMEYAVSILDLPDVKCFSSSVESFQAFEHKNPYYLDTLLEQADSYII